MCHFLPVRHLGNGIFDRVEGQNITTELHETIYFSWKIIILKKVENSCIVAIHIQLYTYRCRNKINNNDERTYFFRKIYLSLFIRNGCEKGYERVMCERWVGDWINCNVLTTSSFVFCSTSFLVLLGYSVGGPESP